MDFTVKNLYQFFYQGLLAKLSPLGFSKKGDSIVKTMQNEMVISFYVSIANYDELKMVSVGFWFGNILTHKLWVIFQISVGGREIEDYNPSQFKVAMQVKEGTDFLYEHVILPKLDNIWSYEDAEKYLNFINKYLLETWIPYMQEIDTIEKLEYEVNEGRHLQISITPSVYATIKSVTLETNYMLNGLILAKLVSDEQYILRRAYYVAKDIKDMKDLNCETSEEWTNALIFFDKYSREDLLKMVVEYDEKYLKSPKKSKK